MFQRINKYVVVVLILACFAAAVSLAVAQSRQTQNTLQANPNSTPPAGKISDVAFMAGNWTCESMGGICEEVWSAPMNGSMMGMFRLMKAGKVTFLELCTLTEEEGTLVLKVRHFDGNLKTKDANDTGVQFKLIKLEKNAAFFDGFTIRKLTDGSLDMFVALHKKGEALKEEAFHYRPRDNK